MHMKIVIFQCNYCFNRFELFKLCFSITGKY